MQKVLTLRVTTAFQRLKDGKTKPFSSSCKSHSLPQGGDLLTGNPSEAQEHFLFALRSLYFTFVLCFRKNVPEECFRLPLLMSFCYCLLHVLTRSPHGGGGSPMCGSPPPVSRAPQLPLHAPSEPWSTGSHSEHWNLCPGSGEWGAATEVSCKKLDVLAPRAIIVCLGWALGIQALSTWRMDQVSLTAEFWWVLGSSVVGTPES